MTKTEMTELFAVMSLAWPQAEMFRNGVGKLGPTIALWTACLEEVDYWTAQKALVKLCRSCKFPPTIAELKEKCDEVNHEVKAEIRGAWDNLRLYSRFGEKSLVDVYHELKPGDRSKAVIDAMGGPDKLYITCTHTFGDGRKEEVTEANVRCFFDTYERLLRKQSTGLPAHTERRAIKDG